MKVAAFFLLIVVGCNHNAPEPSPYAGQETNAVKALSEQERSDYLSGAGMGLAKVAELNQYPGPRHVLDLADELSLSAEQRRQTQAVFDRMNGDARRLGEQIVAQEEKLDALFASGSAAAADIRDLVDEIGGLQAALRFTHLDAHLHMVDILAPAQVERYVQLRGYDDDPELHQEHPGHG